MAPEAKNETEIAIKVGGRVMWQEPYVGVRKMEKNRYITGEGRQCTVPI